jgi:MarR family transcriptional regulator, temperature-dependent positive regulator of motility
MRAEVSTGRHQTSLYLVLSALERSSDQAQRAIAQTTGLNLARVNYCLKELVGKGHVKLQNVGRNPNKMGYLYILTPEGLREKTVLAYQFFRRAAAEYSEVLAQVIRALDEVVECGQGSLCFYGAGGVAEICYHSLRDHGRLSLACLVDEGRQGHRFHGLEVRPERWLQEAGSLEHVLLCEPELLERAQQLVPAERLHLIGRR